jgi:hypothetical protein
VVTGFIYQSRILLRIKLRSSVIGDLVLSVNTNVSEKYAACILMVEKREEGGENPVWIIRYMKAA